MKIVFTTNGFYVKLQFQCACFLIKSISIFKNYISGF